MQVRVQSQKPWKTKGNILLKCWFCEKNESENMHDIELDFERYNYTDRRKQEMGEQPDVIKKTLVVPRCNSCSRAHQRYNTMSLYAVIPMAVLASALFLLFARVDQNYVFIIMALSVIGFGLVVWARRRFLKHLGVKAMVELEMQNETIQKMLADGWYRK